jgi:glycosyltransferase involved in cell wall biosynthesis
MHDFEPVVSVNIPTYNSERHLDECLQSVANQTYPNIETIVIDGHSRDRTLEIAKRHGARVYFGKMLSQRRRIGVEMSLGKYIFLVDSDQVLDRHAVSKCVEKCEKEGYDMVTLFEQSILETRSFVERTIAYDKWLFHSQHDDDATYGAAIPRFFRAAVLGAIEWPGELITFDHTFLHYAVAKTGARSCFVAARIYHHEASSLKQVVRKFYTYGFYYIPALRRNKRLAIFHSMPRRAYFTRRALTNPLLFPGLFVLYLTKAIAALAGAVAYCLARGVERLMPSKTRGVG